MKLPLQKGLCRCGGGSSCVILWFACVSSLFTTNRNRAVCSVHLVLQSIIKYKRARRELRKLSEVLNIPRKSLHQRCFVFCCGVEVFSGSL
jgi:hypothetical protein